MMIKPMSGGLPPALNSTIRRIRTTSFSCDTAGSTSVLPQIQLTASRPYSTRDHAQSFRAPRPSLSCERPARSDPRRHISHWRHVVSHGSQLPDSRKGQREDQVQQSKSHVGERSAHEDGVWHNQEARQQWVHDVRRFVEQDPYEAIFGWSNRRLRGKPEPFRQAPATSDVPSARRQAHASSTSQPEIASERDQGRDRSRIIDTRIRWISRRRAESEKCAVLDEQERVYDPISGKMIRTILHTSSSSDTPTIQKHSKLPESKETNGDAKSNSPSLAATSSPSGLNIVKAAVNDRQLQKEEIDFWARQYQEERQLENAEKPESAFSQLRALSERLDRLSRAKDAIAKRHAKAIDPTTKELHAEESAFWRKQYRDENALGLENQPPLQGFEAEEEAFWCEQLKKERELDAKSQDLPIGKPFGGSQKPSSAREIFARRQQNFMSRLERPIMMSTPFADADRNAKLSKAIEACRQGTAGVGPAASRVIDSQSTQTSSLEESRVKHPLEDAGSGCSKRSSMVQIQQREWESTSDRAERQAAREHTIKTQRPPATNQAWKDFKAGKPFRPSLPKSLAGSGYQSLSHDTHACLSIFRKDKPLKYMSVSELHRHKAAITDSLRQRRQQIGEPVDETLDREIKHQKLSMDSFESKWHWREENAHLSSIGGEAKTPGIQLSTRGSNPTTNEPIDTEEKSLVREVQGIYELAYGKISTDHVQGKLDKSLEAFEQLRPGDTNAELIDEPDDVVEKQLETALKDYDKMDQRFEIDAYSNKAAEGSRELIAMESALDDFDNRHASTSDVRGNSEPWKLQSAVERMSRETPSLRQSARRVAQTVPPLLAERPQDSQAQDTDATPVHPRRPFVGKETAVRHGSWGVNPVIRQRQQAARATRVNPVDGTSSATLTQHTPLVGNFASPTGFVNYDLPVETPEPGKVKQDGKPRYVHREEEIFSGQIPAQKQSTAEIARLFRENGFSEGSAQPSERAVFDKASQVSYKKFGNKIRKGYGPGQGPPHDGSSASEGDRWKSKTNRATSKVAKISAIGLLLGGLAYAVGAGVESARLQALSTPKSYEKHVGPHQTFADQGSESGQEQSLSRLHQELTWLSWGLRGVLLCLFPFLLVLFIGGRD